MCAGACVCVNMHMHLCVCVHVCVCVRTLRIVSTGKIFCFTNTLIIIIMLLIMPVCVSKQLSIRSDHTQHVLQFHEPCYFFPPYMGVPGHSVC